MVDVHGVKAIEHIQERKLKRLLNSNWKNMKDLYKRKIMKTRYNNNNMENFYEFVNKQIELLSYLKDPVLSRELADEIEKDSRIFTKRLLKAYKAVKKTNDRN
jgi:hypothetical protein